MNISPSGGSKPSSRSFSFGDPRSRVPMGRGAGPKAGVPGPFRAARSGGEQTDGDRGEGRNQQEPDEADLALQHRDIGLHGQFSPSPGEGEKKRAGIPSMGVEEDAVSSYAFPQEVPMPTQPAAQPRAPQPPRKTAQPPAEAPAPAPDAITVKPTEEGAIFRALLDAGAEAMVAYTVEKRIHTMVSEAVAPQLQPFLVEMCRLSDAHEKRFAEQDRRFDEVDRRLDALAAAGVERDRRLDVVVARLDGMKVLGQVILGALALLITALIAVFGFVFTN